MGCPIEPDEHFLITWDIDLAVENNLEKWLCTIVKSVQLSCANQLNAADLELKV